MDEEQLADQLGLTSINRKLLKKQLKQFMFEKPGPVIHKGQPVSGAYIVMEGQLRVYTYSTQGTEATLYFLRQGETCVLTLNCLFNDLRYPAWVESAANTRVAMIPGELYRQLFALEASVQDITVKALSSLVFRLMDELEEVQTCNLDERLARFLLNNATTEGTVKMTQQVLAGHLGTTREVIARLMQGFSEKGMVSTGRGTVYVKDAASLAALVTPENAEWPE